MLINVYIFLYSYFFSKKIISFLNQMKMLFLIKINRLKFLLKEILNYLQLLKENFLLEKYP